MPRSSWPAAAHPVRRRVRRGRRLPRPSRPASVPSPLASSTTAWPRCRRASRSSSPTCPGGSCSTTSRTCFAMDVDGSNVVEVAAEPGGGVRWRLVARRRVGRLPRLDARHQRGRRDLRRRGRRLRAAEHHRTIRRTTGAPTGRPTARRSPSTRTATAAGCAATSSTRMARTCAGSTSTPGSSTRRSRRTARGSCSMGHDGGDYDIFVADLATGATRAADRQPGQRRLAGLVAGRLDDRLHLGTRRLPVRAAGSRMLADRTSPTTSTATSGSWTPTARTSVVSPARSGQFVAWSPDGRYLLVSGRALYVVRPDGTGPAGAPRRRHRPSARGIPDWR